MTIPASTRKAGPYTGNDVTVAFAFDFKVFTEADVLVVRAVVATGAETTLTLDSDYSVTLNADQDADPGGTVNYPLAGDELPATQTLTIVGNLENKQATDLPDGGAFNASSVENALDYQNIIAQQLDEKINRAVLVPVSSDTDPQDLIADLFTASDAAAASAAAAGASADDADDDATAAAASAAAAAASAASTGLPVLTGEGLNLLRVKADETGYETRTPAETLADIGAQAAGSYALADGSNLSGLPAGIVQTADIANAQVTPEKMSQPFTSGTAVAGASGTSIDFTGLPSWIKGFAIGYNVLSTNSTSNPQIQIGDSGGVETSGYAGSAACNGDSATATTGVILDNGGGAGTFRNGIITGMLLNPAANMWAFTGVTGWSNVAQAWSIGFSKSLTGTLDRIRLTTVNGTDVFDGGTVNIHYWG